MATIYKNPRSWDSTATGGLVAIPAGSSRNCTFPIFCPITTLAASDQYKQFLLPKRIQVGGNWYIQAPDMDTNGSPAAVVTLRLNHPTLTARPIIHQTTILQTGGVARPSKVPATESGIGFTTDDETWWLELFVDTAAATLAAGTLIIGCDFWGHYPVLDFAGARTVTE